MSASLVSTSLAGLPRARAATAAIRAGKHLGKVGGRPGSNCPSIG